MSYLSLLALRMKTRKLHPRVLRIEREKSIFQGKSRTKTPEGDAIKLGVRRGLSLWTCITTTPVVVDNRSRGLCSVQLVHF